ncbi:DUF2207 domain-containing protein [Georgenia sp. MJ173]|uniref:DUF2207 domain-containing protein n=1 Tax=Georgenia sunbinii TaxID=3117728 RepID=UPI002F269019
MNRGSRIITALAVTALLVLVPSGANAASNDVIRDLDIEITVRPDGMLDVVETYEWDFGSREGLGFTRVLDSRFEYDPEPDMDRVYRYDDFRASSPSGAPAGVWPRTEGARVRADVGAADGSSDRRSGRQTYVLHYTVEGSLNAIRDQDGVEDQEELYWNATGLDWDIPIEAATVTVTGPATIGDHACYQGPRGTDNECDTLSATGTQVTASTGRLDPGEGMTIMAAFPVGTFGEITPILEPASSGPFGDTALGRVTDPIADFLLGNTPWLLPLGIAAPIGFGYWRRRKGRDLHFVGLPPGLLPPAGATPEVAQLSSEPPVAVRFTPPDGLRPAEVGAIHDKHTNAQQMSATIIDLAARGYLRIEETPAAGLLKRTDWDLVATPETAPTDTLRIYEELLLQSLFRGRRRVRLSSLRNSFALTLKQVQGKLADDIDARSLFVKPIQRDGRTSRPFRVVLLVFVWMLVGQGVVISIGAGSVGIVIGAVGGLAVAFGLATALTRKARRQRNAAGRALYEQGRGFELYLGTAEGHQLRFEEGEDIFSRYLPYAMVFDVAERWAGIFEQLRQQGYRVTEPTWYVGTHGFNSRSFSNMGAAMSSFSSTASSTLSSTPGSSGGSGSSGGGGGSSGGGGGGGGGGGR